MVDGTNADGSTETGYDAYNDINVGTMISADFATASVLISFGVVLGIRFQVRTIRD